jgi:hypothetical protein
MRNLYAVACLILMCAVSSQALARECGAGLCASYHRTAEPHMRHRVHSVRNHDCCCRPPSGWGWYLRQRFYHECSAPLAVIDELGDVTWVRGR